jgi:putative transposase
LGTLMKLIHEIPGTTFSSVAERDHYDSERYSCLTLHELEKWLLIAVTKYYHHSPHKKLRK